VVEQKTVTEILLLFLLLLFFFKFLFWKEKRKGQYRFCVSSFFYLCTLSCNKPTKKKKSEKT